jgi:hypothetical protein
MYQTLTASLHFSHMPSRLGRAVFVFFVGDSASTQPIAATFSIGPSLSIEAFTVQFCFDLHRQLTLFWRISRLFPRWQLYRAPPVLPPFPCCCLHLLSCFGELLQSLLAVQSACGKSPSRVHHSALPCTISVGAMAAADDTVPHTGLPVEVSG